MSSGNPVLASEAAEWKRKLLLGVDAGKLRVGSEPKNPYVVWRFDGAGFSVKCYSGSKGMKLHCDQERMLPLIRGEQWDALPVPDFSVRRGGMYHANGKLVRIEKPEEGPRSGRSKAPTAIRLSADQKQCFDAIMKWFEEGSSPVLTFGGYAGTGKTTLIARIAHAFGKQGKIAFCAYTGKAANVLATKLRAAGVDLDHHSCGTIHQLIYKAVTNSDGEVVEWDRQRSLDTALVIVDEASMVGREIWEDLSSYPKVRILAVGDHGQLPPIDGGASMNLMADPELRLEVIHRQARGNPILEFAAWARGGGTPETYAGPSDDRLRILPEGTDLSAVVSAIAADPERLRSTVILCWTNGLRVRQNKLVRAQRGFDADKPTAGDAVICLRNTRFGGVLLANGSRGWLESATPDGPEHWRAVAEFSDEGFRFEGRLCRSQFGRERTYSAFSEYEADTGSAVTDWTPMGLLFDYAYALTVHKAQGSQFRHVLLLDEYPRKSGAATPTYSRWLYTAATRAAETLTVLRA